MKTFTETEVERLIVDAIAIDRGDRLKAMRGVFALMKDHKEGGVGEHRRGWELAATYILRASEKLLAKGAAGGRSQ